MIKQNQVPAFLVEFVDGMLYRVDNSSDAKRLSGAFTRLEQCTSKANRANGIEFTSDVCHSN